MRKRRTDLTGLNSFLTDNSSRFAVFNVKLLFLTFKTTYAPTTFFSLFRINENNSWGRHSSGLGYSIFDFLRIYIFIHWPFNV